MRSVDNSFYRSKEWKRVRSDYIQTHPFCERCLTNGLWNRSTHIHHKIYLNESNIKDPKISLNPDNLEALCIDCHNKEHFGESRRRYKVDDKGNLIIFPDQTLPPM